MLSSWLREAQAALGADNDYIRAVLGGKPPADVARDLIAGTKLGDPAARKALLDGGVKAVESSKDPLIVLARKLDPLARERQKWEEANVEGPLEAAGEKIGQARFEVCGKSVSPDATFTLRLSYGTVKGYSMNGALAPWRTTLFGLYDRSLGFSASRRSTCQRASRSGAAGWISPRRSTSCPRATSSAATPDRPW